MVFLLTVAFVVLVLLEAPDLIRNKYWRELAAYSFLMSLAFTVCLLEILHIEILNPVRDTQYWIKNMLHLCYNS